MTSRQPSLAKNTLLIATAKVTVQGAALLMIPVYTRTLGVREFGFVELVLTYSSLVAPALLLQSDAALFRLLIDLRKDPERARQMVSSAWAIGVSMSILTTATLSTTGLLVDQPGIAHSSVVFGGAMLLALCQQTARGLGQMKVYVCSSLVSGGAILLGNVVALLVLGSGSVGVLYSTAFGCTLGALTAFVGGRFWSLLSVHSVQVRDLRRCLRYGLPLIPNGISWWSIDAGSRAILALAEGLVFVGLYGVATRISQVFAQAFSYFNLAWVETASSSIHDPDREEYYSQVFDRCVRVCCSIIAAMLATLPLYFPLLVAPEFLGAAPLVPLLLLGGLLNAWVTMYSSIYLAMLNTGAVFVTTLSAACIALALATALVLRFGMFGVAIGSICAWLVVLVMRHFMLRRELRLRYSFGTWLCLAVVCLAVPTSAVLLGEGRTWSPTLWGVCAVCMGIVVNRRPIIAILRGLRTRGGWESNVPYDEGQR